MKNPLALFLLGAVPTALVLTAFERLCPLAEDEPPPVTMTDDSRIIEPAAPPSNSTPQVTPEQVELAAKITEDVLRNVSECPKAHKLVAFFPDGTNAVLPIPPFPELLENAGDVNIIRREWKRSIELALAMGATGFQLVHDEPQEKGARA